MSLLWRGNRRLPPLVTVTPRAGPAKKEASTMRPKFTMDFAQSAPLALQRINDAGDWILPNPPPWHCSALTMQATGRSS